MKYYCLFLLLLLVNLASAQTTRKIVKDFDGDGKKDSVFIDSKKDMLMVWLSTQKYKRVESKEITHLNFGNTLVETKKGFEFWNDYDRSGWINVFEYNKTAKKMQLVQMRRSDDMLGRDDPNQNLYKSTVNLLTNKYVGVVETEMKGKVVEKFINAEMIFPKTYLETFSDAINFDYQEKCIGLYNKNVSKK
ncbi:hypothetical protein EZJ43_07880 [Pedobacter changchengzhani]|uniref:VCBS repeat-containing protein n=1 Tax=Pedobacter changchengzhani TaxID=2529274 RepID=A0A4R5MMR7_9SPHI|nr:hypothetical protein [Pedobacter changchengzhani]TDG36429.1 hypothetical protein EZJ43_07880 [Pedobacter changchengzhani]